MLKKDESMICNTCKYCYTYMTDDSYMRIKVMCRKKLKQISRNLPACEHWEQKSIWNIIKNIFYNG